MINIVHVCTFYSGKYVLCQLASIEGQHPGIDDFVTLLSD